MKVVIVGSGELKDIHALFNKIGEVDYIICADGGASHLYRTNIVPDVIIGDLDSISEEALSEYRRSKITLIEFPVKKDKTDMALSVDYAIELGATQIILLGATGSRLDHTLGNIFLLKYILDKGIKPRIINHHNEIAVTKDRLVLEAQKDAYVSIVPLMGDVKGITLTGFEYELKASTLLYTSTLGISNKINKEKAVVEVKEGICLVITAKD